jgi:hypothetical protein
MKQVLMKVLILLLLFTSKWGFSQTGMPNEKPVAPEKVPPQKTIVAKFVEAGVLEGAGSYTFKDSKGKYIYFVFDDYNNQNLPYKFFDKEATTNPEFINSTFKIKYISKWEIRGESEEKVLVNKIVSIKLIKK